MVDRMAPKDVYVLIPGIYEYVMLQGKRDSAGVIKVTGFNIGAVAWIIQLGST